MRNPAINARRQVVTDYGPDPADRSVLGLVHDTLARVQGHLVDAVIGANGDPSTSFTGPGPALQSFVGAGNPGSTTVVYRNGGNEEISSGTVDGDPARAMFAARLRRGRGIQ